MDKTKIKWTEYTWNPWQGCHKVSEGCKNCYMFREKEFYGQNPNIVVRSSKNTFNKPFKIEEPSLIFTCSWSDFFIKEADEWRDDAWEIIKNTPQHTYQILTKRPERILSNLPIEPLKNVFIGVSIENNKNWERVKYLLPLNYKTFISFEPLLEEIIWQDEFGKVDWVIIGAESGNKKGKYLYRDCSLDWIESLAKETVNHKVDLFIKQIRLNGKLITDVSQFPKQLQYQEIP